MSSRLKIIGGLLAGAAILGGSVAVHHTKKQQQETIRHLEAKIDSLENDVFQLDQLRKAEKAYSAQCDSLNNLPSSELPRDFMPRLIQNAKKLSKYREATIMKIR